MAGPNPFAAFTGTSGFACDFLPYRSSNAYFRTLAAATPEDWGNNSALTAKADDTSRWVEVAASQRATWLPSVTNAVNMEALACFLMRPGQYTKPTLSPTLGYETRIDTAAGTVGLYESGTLVASASLPASVWISSSVFVDCWVRVHLQANDRWTGAKVWSTTEAEPNTYTVIFNPTGGVGPAVVSTDPPGIGSASVAAVSACRWFSYGVASVAPTPQVSSNATYYDTWFKTASTGAPRMLAAEIYIPGWNGVSAAAYTTAVLRVATEGYAGGAAWPFTNQLFAEGIIGWPKFSRVLPDTIFGRQSFTVADLLIANPVSASGGLRDDWLRAKVTNAVITLRYGNPSWPWYDLATLFTGTVMEISEEPGVIRLKLRDATGRFDRNVHRTTLTTSNASNGLPTPISAGTVFNATPVQTDSANLVYRVGEADVQAVTTVRDRGVALTTTAVGGSVSRYFAATDLLRMASAHGLAANDIVTLSSNAIAPLATATNYYVLATGLTSTDFKLSTSSGGAAVDITGNVQAIKGTLAFPDLLEFSAAHGLAVNDIVQVSGAGVPGDFTVGTDYYVVSVSGLFVGLSATLGGAAINITPINQKASWTTSPAADTLQTTVAHGYAVNDPISMTGGSPPAPLVADKIYYVQSVPTTVTFTVSLTPGGAAIDITGGTAPANYCVASVFNVLKPATGVTVNTSAYRFNSAAGTLTLLANPAGQITCDITGQKLAGVSATSGYHALGVVIGQRDPIVSVDANHALGLQRSVGLWLTQPTNLLEVLDLLAGSVTAIWGQNRLGTLTFYVAGSAFTAGTVGTITPDDVISTGQIQLINKKLPVAFTDGVRVGHTKNYTVQNDSDLAGSVTAANRALYGAEYTIKVMNAGFTPAVSLDDATKGELRKVPMLQTCVVSDADAQWVGQTNLIDSPKGLSTLTVTVRWAKLDPYRLGVATLVKLARYGIDTNSGQTMVVIGIEEDIANHTVKLTLLCELPGYYPVTT